MAAIPIQQNPGAAQEPANGSGTPVRTETKAPDWSDDIGQSRFSAWRVAVGERLQWLEAELDSRQDSEPPQGVVPAMWIAYRSTKAKSKLASWYSGEHIERSWRALHLAEARVIASSSDLAGRLPAVRERALEDLQAKDLRVKALMAINPNSIGTNDRAVVCEALRAAYATSDNSHTAVRGLRNRLVLFGLLILGLNVLLGALSSFFPNLVPVCVRDFCATGGATPSGGDVWLIELIGALGGAVAVVILLLRTRPSVVAYTLTPYQATIKVMLGAVLAVAGVLFAGSGVLQGVVNNRPALLVLALVFGYAQQLATRLLDNYANDVVGKAQPKASDG
jgi:hypothetical protein